METVLQAVNLTKKYGDFVAVRDLNLTVRKGEIYGFLGPNGAGKSTTILLLLGIERPTSGSVTLFDHRYDSDLFSLRQQIGVAFEQKNLYDEMRATEYLRFFSELYGIPNNDRRIEALLTRLELYERRNDRIQGFSKGMRQKMEIARALLHEPQFLILDEPTSDLDAQGIKTVRDIVLEENKKGKTIFISSHILSEIERICHRVGIINHGNLIIEDTIDGIKNKFSDSTEIELEIDKSCRDDESLIKKLSSFSFIKEIYANENKIFLKTDANNDYRQIISTVIFAHGYTLLGITKKTISLEDAYLTITEGNVSIFVKGGQR